MNFRFLSAIYDGKGMHIEQNRINFMKKLNAIGIVSVSKRALNPWLTKLRLDNDGITITPLRINSKYI